MSSSVEAEYMDITNRNAWPIVYQKMGRECQSYSYTHEEARKPQNKPLNRYRDVNPYDHSRIILKRCDSSDYINANLVKMGRANRRYILTQGPLRSTVGHFWLMVWEQNSRAILMLNKVIEKNEVKCHWYWPQGLGEEHQLILPDVSLTIEQVTTEDCGYYTKRVFKIFDDISQESREVIHFHYTTWPDFGVPQSPSAFLNFLKNVRASGALEPDVGPAIVHCSAGIGRSGTFCLVDSCLVIIEKEGVDSVNVIETLLAMRRDRMGLIQTPEQLRFSYQAIIEGAKRLDPEWQEESREEPIYASVADDDTPPPPPPRVASLEPRLRPQKSCSMGDLAVSPSHSSPSSDIPPPTPPKFFLPSPPSSSSDNEEEALLDGGADGNVGPSLRRRKVAELADRVSNMKRRARDAERWNELKRFKSEENPQTEPRQD